MKPKHTVPTEAEQAARDRARPFKERFQVVFETLSSPPVIGFAAFTVLCAAGLAWYSQRPPDAATVQAAPKAQAGARKAAATPANCREEFRSGDVALAGSYAPPFLDSHLELRNGSERPALVRIVRTNGHQRFATVSVGPGQTERVSVQPDKYELEFVHGTRWCGLEAGFADASAPVLLEGIEAKSYGQASVDLAPRA